jgi:putative intracellular protease/amidase
MSVSRRDLGLLALLGAAVGGEGQAAAPPDRRGPRPSADTGYWTDVRGGERIALVMYPGMTALDIIAPHYFLFTMKGARVDLVSKTRAPVLCDRNVTLTPTATFDDMPADLDMIFLPGGGAGTLAAMDDDGMIGFLADRGARARYVTSICTGALILGAAGLLRGYRATAHWKVRDPVLPSMGAAPVAARVVEDRNRITGAGVTAGIDFALHMVAKLRGVDNARVVQLIAEYAPEPAFQSGSPATAWPATTRLVTDLLPEFNQTAIRIAGRRLAARSAP